MKPTIITCAVTGGLTTVKQHPGLPCTPEEIANACIGAARAGAAIVHIHVRYPDGRPSMELEHYREVVDRVRSSPVDVIINLTTGPGGRFVPSEEDPKFFADGTTLTTPERRMEHILALKPEICSLDLNTMYFGSAVVMNTPRNVRIMAKLAQEAGVLPEIEVFDSGDIQLANDLISEGTLSPASLFQIVLGVKYGAIASPASLMHMQSLLPEGSNWAAFGIGRWSYPILVQSWLLGGQVRVGLEDNIYIKKGVLAPDNASHVNKAVRILTELDVAIANPSEARTILGLK